MIPATRQIVPMTPRAMRPWRSRLGLKNRLTEKIYHVARKSQVLPAPDVAGIFGRWMTHSLMQQLPIKLFNWLNSLVKSANITFGSR